MIVVAAVTTALTATSRLRVGSGICLAVERDPIITAKEVASVDYLSGGRFLSCDFSAHRAELPTMAGIAADAMDAEFRRLEPVVTDGRLSLSEAYARIMRACGTEPGAGRRSGPVV